MNRKWKSILIVLLVVLMLVLMTGGVVAERIKEGSQVTQYRCYRWAAIEPVAENPITYIGNGMCTWTVPD